MKLTFPTAFIVTMSLAVSAVAQDLTADAKSAPPDKHKFSYALGMNLATQLKSAGADVDVDAVAKAMRDVLENKPTELQESEIRPIFMAMQAYSATKKYDKSQKEAEAFMAKNAKIPGVVTLPNGIQYNMIKEGTGDSPKGTNTLVMSWRGLWVDGSEFGEMDNIAIQQVMCPTMWQDILPLMKAGSKCQIVVPSRVAYAHVNDRVPGYGSALVYNLELIALQPDAAHPSRQFGGGRMGHNPDEEFLPKAPRPAK